MANVLGELFGEIAESIRSKTGDTATMKPAQFPEKISAIKTPSSILPLSIAENGTYTAPSGVAGYNPIVVDVAGSSEELRYVTFLSYDGSFEYGKKAVAVGDDCADPIARGIFATPTRESDAQYNYTFYGWATTPNGAADSNALKAVNEDRTVYANFSAAVRYYTITYYDSDGTTVLKTESLAYGSMPSYEASKEDVVFSGWIPELSYVVGDTSYVAVWEEKVTFATASWTKIAEICAAGKAKDYFAIGDTKDVGSLKVAIVDFDHDDLADGSGKAPMTLALIVLPKVTLYINSDSYSSWSSSELRSTIASQMTTLPEELQAIIKEVKKTTCTTSSTTFGTSYDRLWAFSAREISPKNTSTHAEGYQYPYFDSFDKAIMQVVGGTTKKAYWLRTHAHWNDYKVFVDTNGVAQSISGGKTYNIHYGFCI